MLHRCILACTFKLYSFEAYASCMKSFPLQKCRYFSYKVFSSDGCTVEVATQCEETIDFLDIYFNEPSVIRTSQ